MSARMTIVLEDDSLYRRLKVHAAMEGLTLKDAIEVALRGYLDGLAPVEEDGTPEVDWAAFDRWQADVDQLNDELGDDVPDDLSDIKHYLYGAPRQRTVRMIAEELAPYDAR